MESLHIYSRLSRGDWHSDRESVDTLWRGVDWHAKRTVEVPDHVSNVTAIQISFKNIFPYDLLSNSRATTGRNSRLGPG